eukprot:2602881-Pyramimonas_sp.AAC.1
MRAHADETEAEADAPCASASSQAESAMRSVLGPRSERPLRGLPGRAPPGAASATPRASDPLSG